MSNIQEDLVMTYFLNQSKAPGNRLPRGLPESNINKSKKYDNRFSDIEQSYGRRPKRVLDKNLMPRNYSLYTEIHKPSLDFYENMEWWERDSSNDFLGQLGKKA